MGEGERPSRLLITFVQKGEKEVKWAEKFNNPNSTVVFVSNDGVGFRLDQAVAKKESGFIRNTLELVDHNSQDSVDEGYFALDVDAATLRFLVAQFLGGFGGFMRFSEEVVISREMCCRLLQVANHLDAPVVEWNLMWRMQQHHPWEIFKAAARRKQVGIARTSVKYFDKCENYKPFGSWPRYTKQDTNELEGIPVSWILALANLRLEKEGCKINLGEQGSFVLAKSWMEVGEHFHPLE